MKVIVLNADFQPINVTSLRKGYKLVYKKKAEILVSYDGEFITLSTHRIGKPKIIRLYNKINIPYRKIIPTRENIFKRDGFQCVYCPSKDNLTIDHVIPKSRGGGNTWLNMVTCCNKCNGKKDNRTPQEAEMEMRIKPFQPSLMSLINIDPKNIIEEVMKRAT